MKQTGILLLYGIFWSNLFFSTAEECGPEGPVLEFVEISRGDVSMEWNKACFDNAESYTITLSVPNDSCNKTVQCAEDGLCRTTLLEMNCERIVGPCVNITVTINGNNIEISNSTHLAPWFKDTDWKLENSVIKKYTFSARWGPPDNPISPDVSCATSAKVTATCPDTVVQSQVVSLEPADQGAVDFDLRECSKPGKVILEVIYMAGNVPTTTKNSAIRDYKPDTYIQCYDCDANNTKCNDPFMDSLDDETLKTKAIYKLCVKEDDPIKRYGAVESDSYEYSCYSNLCNGAPNVAVATMMLFAAAVACLLHPLLQQ